MSCSAKHSNLHISQHFVCSCPGARTRSIDDHWHFCTAGIARRTRRDVFLLQQQEQQHSLRQVLQELLAMIRSDFCSCKSRIASVSANRALLLSNVLPVHPQTSCSRLVATDSRQMQRVAQNQNHWEAWESQQYMHTPGGLKHFICFPNET